MAEPEVVIQVLYLWSKMAVSICSRYSMLMVESICNIYSMLKPEIEIILFFVHRLTFRTWDG
jgi:hypothetical protein